jgi:predicted CXXCH cytochrome family protein
MHGAGVGCVDCHEPHGGGLRREGDALCRGCHDGLGTVAHDLHDPPRACVDCHMPTTVFMARDPRHDHGFVLPDPVSAERLGLPDPCLGCHEASEALSAAYREHYRGGHRQVAAVVAGALRGDPSVVEELADLIGHEEPRIRQRAAGAAGALATQVAVARALEAAIDDDDGWVRFAAVSSLAEAGPSQALRGALDDELRAVRVAAARGMVGSLDASHAAADDYRAYLRHNADQPAALAEQARWALAVGHLDEALGAFDASLALDPDHLPAFDGRAVVRAGLGDHQGALEDARRAARLAPDDAELRFRLGLALVGAGERGEAEAVLQSLPGHGRALQQLGLLRVARGDHAGGLAALFAAEDQSPEDAEIRYLIAWALADWGRLDDARLAARRVLAVDPDHADARALLRRLP